MENTAKEVMETIVEEAPEVIAKGIDRFWKGFGAGVVTAVGGFVADKFVVRPTIKKIKNKKAAKNIQEDYEESNAVNVDFTEPDEDREE